MSGFSVEWLGLREQADLRARSHEVMTALASLFANDESITVLDLGCGTGANLRATAMALPHQQTWRLIDNDPILLAAARERLIDWAEDSQDEGSTLTLTIGRKRLTVEFIPFDLAGGIETLLTPRPDLVTASALFDLVSSAWMERLVHAMAHWRLPLYAPLIATDETLFEPSHTVDGAVLAAFASHMQRNKGFGPAAGMKAADVLGPLFAGHGYHITAGNSPWVLGPDGHALSAALVQGIADAVGETGRVDSAQLAQWHAARRGPVTCQVGHRDILAAPPPH